MHLQENTLFDLWPWPGGQGYTKSGPVPFQHVTYPGTKFEVATSNHLGDTFTRNVTEGRTHRRTDFGTKLIYPFLLKKKRV